MRAAWLISAIIWLKELSVGVVFFLHKELSKNQKNQSVCFEHYPMRPWEYPLNYYRFAVGFLFPLAILTVAAHSSSPPSLPHLSPSLSSNPKRQFVDFNW